MVPGLVQPSQVARLIQVANPRRSLPSEVPSDSRKEIASDVKRDLMVDLFLCFTCAAQSRRHPNRFLPPCIPRWSWQSPTTCLLCIGRSVPPWRCWLLWPRLWPPTTSSRSHAGGCFAQGNCGRTTNRV